MKKTYKCICGKEFTNPQSFNGHKSHCKEHQIAKHGSLDKYNALQKDFQQESVKANYNLYLLRKENKEKQLQQWISEQHRCETCGKVMTEYYGSGRFCSRSCANTRKHSNETKKKISNSCKISKKVKNVVKTGQKFKRKSCKRKNKKTQKFCSICGKQICYSNKSGYCINCIRTSNELIDFRKRIAKNASMHVKNRKYWEPRNQTSYAEKFFIEVLNNNNIKFEHDYKVTISKHKRYYLDFYIKKNNTKLDLEIDGKQHSYPDRAKHDLKRDKKLKELGYVIYRIDWNEINSDKGKELMKQKIDNFIDFYNKL